MWYEPSTYSGAPDECSIHWPEKLPCSVCSSDSAMTTDKVWLLTEPNFHTWLPDRTSSYWNGPGWTIRQLAEAWELRLEQVHMP